MTTALYDTEITHARRTPVMHTFRYRSASWFIDVDAPPEVPWWLRPFVGFRAHDHLGPVPSGPDTLRGRAEHALRGHGVLPPGGRITALLNARCLGYVFDPLTVFWCHDRNGAVRAVIAEVHNTYGGRHAYVLGADAASGTVVDKDFYVSPFNPVEGRYRLRTPEPAERLAIDVVLDRTGQAPFVATWRGTRRPASVPHIVRAQLRAPLVPLVLAARIRWHGIRLWAKGLPIVPRAPGARGPSHRSGPVEQEANP
ncbi:hypothetical protein TPAU25S_01082 [Tsukamurella paurometabola]|uniref:DUF1365 domain-containing protein n=1 Tax=Tsukamurella paurometabola (strain ATCC 8368 / DSM 20162 / CCUG 35730 / CIP 100753 / JCM 10117 / KCTC 9821 / NBRC 16120 / NCIMB 702349 / NCTC 13040) TaxID=521096 RepID=D5UXS5_TSUPD|nr:DUF1365 domain-containing protein [Tsukamurella paurometabola]ADG80162.1 protein of unknown function DUF1365 [Tsukamurella paurometabola DSM 20162]SUP38661.1 Protein of uncharacterised function (DUF1365) [Tsukamurella paurometabola]